MIKGNVKRKVRNTIEVLRELSQYQGYAGLSVFDAGVTEGFNWTVKVNLERDGLLFDKAGYDGKKSFENVLMALLTGKVK